MSFIKRIKKLQYVSNQQPSKLTKASFIQLIISQSNYDSVAYNIFVDPNKKFIYFIG